MNKLLSFNPEPFESDSELEGAFQEYDAEGNGLEREVEFEFRRSRSRSPYSRPKSARPQRVYAKPTRQQPRLKPDLVNAGLSKPPPLTSRLPFMSLKPSYHRFPGFSIFPPAWPLSPIPEKPEPPEPRGAGRPGGEPSGGQPPEQEPREAPSEYVRWVQSCLNQVMGLRLPLDGIMSAATRSAVRSFQERRGLPMTGLVGPETERVLMEICAAAGPPTPGTPTPVPFGTALELPWMTEAEWESGTVSRPRQHPPARRPAFSTGVMAAFDSPAFRQKIVQIANQELVRWGNGSIKETDPRVRRVIQDYWKTGTGKSYSEAQLGDPAFHKNHPWSAAFISWVMRTAGAGNLFKYSSAHAVYVKWAKDNRLANNDNPFKAYRITESAPQVGDLVCKRRAGSGATYENIRPGMKTHCDIVTGVAPGRIIMVGGNVDNSVAQKTIRTNASGFLTDPDYFAVIRIGEVGAPGIAPPAPIPPQRTVAAPKLLKQESAPPGTTLYVNIDLGIVDKSGITATPSTGIFIPTGYVPAEAVDVILYLHGHKPSKNPRLTIDQYWNSQRFPYGAFREGINASGRNVVLVAPTLGAHSEAGSLVMPGGLDAYLVQVLESLRAYGPHSRMGATPSLGNLILTCHSGGGWPMRQLAGGRRGLALPRIRECWGFDCTYNRGDDTFWAGWARARPNDRVYIYYIANSKTAPLAESLRRMGVPNAIVRPSKDRRHNYVPFAYWQERITEAPFLGPRAGNAGSTAATFSREIQTVDPEFHRCSWSGEYTVSQPSSFRQAIEQNRRYAESLGWRQHIDRIVQLLGFTNMTPGEQLFAEAVARWQRSRGLKPDGVIGPNTWRQMQRALSLGPSAPPPRPRAQALCRPPQGMSAAEQTALALTTRFETGTPFGCVVSATDGISMGMLQWNLLAGTLQEKLATFEQQTGRLQQFFGAETERVKRLVALRGSRDLQAQAVREALAEKLANRWRDALLRLCADTQFCALLMADVMRRMKRAREATRQLNLRTIRGLCMLFDVEVGDGYGAKNRKLTAFAERIQRRENELGRVLSEQEKLVEIADLAASLAGSKWGAERRARRMLIAKGSGRYRNSEWNLDGDFPNLGEAWDVPGAARPPVAPTVPRPPEPDIVSVRGIRVARQIAPQVASLLAAAEADGVRLGGWGYRSKQSQIELRKRHCGTSHYDIYQKPSSQCTPPTARPGASMHEKGLAIDFTHNGRGITSRTNPGFQWLSRNAARFGLRNLPSEPWHWSVNGR